MFQVQVWQQDMPSSLTISDSSLVKEQSRVGICTEKRTGGETGAINDEPN